MSAREGSGAMFDAIAPRYDLLNRVMSLGVDQGWRRRTVEAVAPALAGGGEQATGDRQQATGNRQQGPGGRQVMAGGEAGTGAILDLATGTADLAIAMARRWPGARVTGLDPSVGMLAVGQKKLAATPNVRLLEGDARALPFAAASFDAVTMAFGIRNVPAAERVLALAEMARVTRPGGRVAILELGEPRGVLGPLARFHVHTLVPRLGAWLSGAREYRYLERSIAAFPAPERVADLMRVAGLRVLELSRLTFGACCLYVATPEVRG